MENETSEPFSTQAIDPFPLLFCNQEIEIKHGKQRRRFIQSSTTSTSHKADVDGGDYGGNIVNSSLGLFVSITDTMRSFLMASSSNPYLSDDLIELAASVTQLSSTSYKHIRSIWVSSNPKTRPDLMDLFYGSGFVLSSPHPREKSEELKARLRKLAEVAERKSYEELVKDITPKRDAEELFSSYKDQMGFGLHVGLTMFTGYFVGYGAFRALFDRCPTMGAAGGILGIVGGMLVETLLFIIKTTNDERKLRVSTSHMKKDK